MPASRLTRIDLLLFALAIAAACLWLFRSATGPTTGWWLLAKAIVLPILALIAWRHRLAAGGAWLAVALLAHGAGDLLLEIRFLAGVAAFFVGHLLYIALFWRHRRPLEEIGGGIKLGIGALGLVGALVLLLLAPRLDGVLEFAVPLYALALVAMATTALASGRGQPWITVGALAFVASDALLSMELFLGGMTPGRLLVWPLYVAGQVAIAWGWIVVPARAVD